MPRKRRKRKALRRKPPKWNLASRIRSALRKIWMYSPMRKEALDAAFTRQIGPVKYRRCAECQKEFPTKDVAVDHIIPAGTMPGTKYAKPEDTLDAFAGRMFCPSSKLRVLCEKCHLVVTNKQREERRKA